MGALLDVDNEAVNNCVLGDLGGNLGQPEGPEMAVSEDGEGALRLFGIHRGISVRERIALSRRSNFERGRRTRRPHLRHLRPISAPRRTTRQS
jgi:hypothetical protein